MKTYWQRLIRSLVLLAFILTAAAVNSEAQTLRPRQPAQYGIIPMFTNNPAAMFVITNLLQEPMPELSVPAVSQAASAPGTYWTLKGAPVPLPFNPYPELPVYQVTTNGQFIIDDRSVDYATLDELAALEAEAYASTNTPVFTGCQICEWNDRGLLWLDTSNSLVTPDYFTVLLHNTVQGQSYDVMTTPVLTTAFSTELVVTGAVGNATSIEIPMNNRTNLFVRARTSAAYSFYLIAPPLSQDVLAGDTVTFYVETGGNTNLTFQWTLNGSPIAGATNSTYTIYNVQSTDAGDYACIVSDGTNALTTPAGTLTVESGLGDVNQMMVISPRQNYTFKSGVTYYIGGQIPLYGNTIIEAGAVIKMDWYFSSGLQIMGTLTCKGEPYYPAVLTSVDDDSFGEQLFDYANGDTYSDEDGPPQPYQTGVPYLELACCQTNSINNLRIAYADYGVTTPTALQRLDVWDCQFLQCNYGVVNLVAGGATNTLHNVLFAACGAALGADTNAITVEAEQVTADVADFCLAYATPSRMALTNCIIWGSSPSASSLSSVHVEENPDGTNFVSSGAGIYYLAANSQFHQSGAAGISPRLQTALKNKTTFAPLAMAPFTAISGQITLGQQVQRYTNGAPDIGYYYDALDYTVADLRLTGGTVNVLPGTAVGFRLDYVVASQQWTMIGMDVRENSTLNAQGMPNKPCVFVDVQQVQEQFQYPVWSAFIPDYLPTYDSDLSPALNFRFANFYAGYVSYYSMPQYHFWSGISLYGYEWSLDSAVNLTMQDCKVRGGQIDIGTPDNPDYGQGLLDYDTVLGSGAIAWKNSLFDGVNINLNPTYYWTNQVVNCDLQVTAYNNLFRNSPWLIISGVPASAGNWAFRDNLFDKVQFFQNLALPLDFDHNGYWPLVGQEIIFAASGYTNSLQATATSSGATEVFLNAAPPYQSGAFGSYYFSQTTPLYQAGSRTASDAGLTQYTTFTNQSKDSGSQPVNIGLHYVAATNCLPLDTDGDGVPDYVEVEHGTDLNNAMTDGVTNDTYNAAYDDVDLSGDGLVGRIKKALGLDPLGSQNPLVLKQVITGEEPDFATFEVPVNYDAVTNSGELNINMNGIDVTLEECTRATDGNCLLSFNVAFDPPGAHLISAGFRLGDEPPSELNPVLTAAGSLTPFISTNCAQFFESGSMFDDTTVYLDANVSIQNTDYTITLYNPDTNPRTLLAVITNTPTSGMIQQQWDLTCSDGSHYAGDNLDAEYEAADNTGGSGNVSPFAAKAKKTLTRAAGSLSEWGPNFDLAYFYEPTNGLLSSAYAKDGAVWNGMLGVVNALTMPAFGYDVYNSYFDHYFCYYCGPGQQPYPGYITSRATVTNSLLPDMTNGLTKQVYISGHGENGTIGEATGNVGLESSDVANGLNNHYTKKKLVSHNPYRFVFLDGCSTASGKKWRRAFGIYPLDAQSQAGDNHAGPQAYVGWAAEHDGWMSYNNTSDPIAAQAYTQTLNRFYSMWMTGSSLKSCIDAASVASFNTAPLLVPKNKNVHIWGNDPVVGPWSGDFTNLITSKIYIIGFPGLKVDRTDTGLNSDKTYAAPTNVE